MYAYNIGNGGSGEEVRDASYAIRSVLSIDLKDLNEEIILSSIFKNHGSTELSLVSICDHGVKPLHWAASQVMRINIRKSKITIHDRKTAAESCSHLFIAENNALATSAVGIDPGHCSKS
ncbi:hypothetical protein T01_6818 [Trichinella spiralis]|uniref:Uncharacterized protein n=1 Tax=Trichinella spiralis TaxID=6334 RepID=A0A0V1BJZ2_TRISP|nr:hypothetical protein T01_6818 [Trichinella spiralis]